MSESDGPVTATVEVAVPPAVEERARERAQGGESFEKYLLDEFVFEYEWQFSEESET